MITRLPGPASGLQCSVCYKPVVLTKSGWVCINGHGGAEEPITKEHNPEDLIEIKEWMRDIRKSMLDALK